MSPNLNSLDDIRKLQRPLRVVRGLAQDLLWADPETGTKGFQVCGSCPLRLKRLRCVKGCFQQNKIRAVSHIFGEETVRDKCKQLNIDLVIRAHQVGLVSKCRTSSWEVAVQFTPFNGCVLIGSLLYVVTSLGSIPTFGSLYFDARGFCTAFGQTQTTRVGIEREGARLYSLHC